MVKYSSSGSLRSPSLRLLFLSAAALASPLPVPDAETFELLETVD